MGVELCGPDEIAARLGVRPNTVSMWRARGLLPEPIATVSRVPVWPWALIRAWADASGRLDAKRETPTVSRAQVDGARAVLLAEIDALAHEAKGALGACGVPSIIRKPPARRTLRDAGGRFGSLDGHGNGSGAWDWFWQLSERDRDWLGRAHFGPEPYRSAPDQVAQLMGMDTDAAMSEWVRLVRVVDAASALHHRVPWRRCSHLFAGLASTYNPGALFGTYAEAASYLADLQGQPGEEQAVLRTRLGPSPIEMEFEDWSEELTRLEGVAAGLSELTEDVLSAEDAAVYDRLEELLPSSIVGGEFAGLEDAYVAAVGAYLAALVEVA
ncbi:MAG: hypothetical protein JWN10_1459 [Solirubrobacterales bacterium]|nr:hypothetical protein [Solirubrobacterales bacterium]